MHSCNVHHGYRSKYTHKPLQFLKLLYIRVLLNILDSSSCATCSLLVLFFLGLRVFLHSRCFFYVFIEMACASAVGRGEVSRRRENVFVKKIHRFHWRPTQKKIIFWLTSFDIETNNDSKCTLFLILFRAVHSVIFLLSSSLSHFCCYCCCCWVHNLNEIVQLKYQVHTNYSVKLN